MSVNTNQESVSHESIIRVFVLTLTIPCVPCGLLMINDSQESLFRMIDSVLDQVWPNMTKESYNLTINIKIPAKIGFIMQLGYSLLTSAHKTVDAVALIKHCLFKFQ